MHSYLITWLAISSLLAATACGTKDRKKDRGIPATDNPQILDCTQSDDPQCSDLATVVDGSKDRNADGHTEDYWTDSPAQNDDASQSDQPYDADKKDEDHPGQSDDDAGQNDDPSQNEKGDDSSSDESESEPPVDASKELRIRTIDSWLNFDINGEGVLVNDQGSCLQSMQLGADNSATLTLNRMQLIPSYVGLSEFSRCRASVRLSYRSGWRFAVSRVSFAIEGRVQNESQAWLEGLASTKPFDESNDQKRRLLLNRAEISDQDVVIEIPEEQRSWSDCDQEDRLRLEIGLYMNFKTLPETTRQWEEALAAKEAGLIDHGDLRILGEEQDDLPKIKLEFAWRACDKDQ